MQEIIRDIILLVVLLLSVSCLMSSRPEPSPKQYTHDSMFNKWRRIY